MSNRVWAIAGVVVALLAAVVDRADAQLIAPPTPPPYSLSPFAGMEILATPYLWFPWSSVSIRPSDTRFASKSTTIDPGELYSHLTWAPFMSEAEFRHRPYGLIIDYIHAPLKSGVSTRNVLFNGATGGLTIDSGTALFTYRLFEQPDQYFDVGAGVRAWGLAGSINLNEGLLPGLNVANGLSWGDPLMSARYHRELGNGLSVTGYGDVGGFGVGAHFDWQLVATVDYAATPSIDLHGGFRSLNFSYGAPQANIKFNMNGPIISATIHF